MTGATRTGIFTVWKKYEEGSAGGRIGGAKPFASFPNSCYFSVLRISSVSSAAQFSDGPTHLQHLAPGGKSQPLQD